MRLFKWLKRWRRKPPPQPQEEPIEVLLVRLLHAVQRESDSYNFQNTPACKCVLLHFEFGEDIAEYWFEVALYKYDRVPIPLAKLLDYDDIEELARFVCWKRDQIRTKVVESKETERSLYEQGVTAMRAEMVLGRMPCSLESKWARWNEEEEGQQPKLTDQ